ARRSKSPGQPWTPPLWYGLPGCASFPLAPGDAATHIWRMLRQYELVERVKAYDPDADEALLNRAYVYTVQKHGTQKRASGDPYFSHPIEVAGLMTDL